MKTSATRIILALATSLLSAGCECTGEFIDSYLDESQRVVSSAIVVDSEKDHSPGFLAAGVSLSDEGQIRELTTFVAYVAGAKLSLEGIPAKEGKSKTYAIAGNDLVTSKTSLWLRETAAAQEGEFLELARGSDAFLGWSTEGESAFLVNHGDPQGGRDRKLYRRVGGEWLPESAEKSWQWISDGAYTRATLDPIQEDEVYVRYSSPQAGVAEKGVIGRMVRNGASQVVAVRFFQRSGSQETLVASYAMPEGYPLISQTSFRSTLDAGKMVFTFPRGAANGGDSRALLDLQAKSVKEARESDLAQFRDGRTFLMESHDGAYAAEVRTQPVKWTGEINVRATEVLPTRRNFEYDVDLHSSLGSIQERGTLQAHGIAGHHDTCD